MVSGDEAQKLNDLLADKKADLALKLKRAAANELVYWEGPKIPPNLPRQHFEVFLSYLEEGDITSFTISFRESDGGKYGATGLDWVFKFEISLDIAGVPKRYFCKGFFFEKTVLKGVEIQSFREASLTLVS